MFGIRASEFLWVSHSVPTSQHDEQSANWSSQCAVCVGRVKRQRDNQSRAILVARATLDRDDVDEDPSATGALRPRSLHRKHPGPCARCLLACASFEIHEFLEIVALCPTSLAFNLSQVSRKRFSCCGSQRSSTRSVDVSRREQKARQAQ